MKSHDDADLVALRETLAPRLAADPEPALDRTWAALTAPAPREAPAELPAGWLVPAGAAATVAALAAGSVLLLGGGDEVSPAGLDDIPRITDPSQIVFPMDTYDHTTEGYRSFVEAVAYLASDCLARFGEEVSPYQLAPGPPVVTTTKETPLGTVTGQTTGLSTLGHDRLFGVFDLELAQQWGYGVPPDWGTVWPSFPDADPSMAGEPLTELHEFLLRGRTDPAYTVWSLIEDNNGDPMPEDGCHGEAERIVTGGLPDPDFRVTNNDAQGRAWHHPMVQAAEAEWSACMARAGYEYDSMWDAGPENFRDPEDWDAPASQAEIAEAVASVNCKIESNLVGVLVAVTSEYEEQFIQENRAELQELKHWLDTVYANSAEVLADHS